LPARPPLCWICTLPSSDTGPSRASQCCNAGSVWRARRLASSRQPSGRSCSSPSATSPSPVCMLASRHCPCACSSNGQPPCSRTREAVTCNSPAGLPQGVAMRWSSAASRACTLRSRASMRPSGKRCVVPETVSPGPPNSSCRCIWPSSARRDNRHCRCPNRFPSSEPIASAWPFHSEPCTCCRRSPCNWGSIQGVTQRAGRNHSSTAAQTPSKATPIRAFRRYLKHRFPAMPRADLSAHGASVDDSRMNVPENSNAALAARDLRHVWHPCTQMHDHESIPMLPIVRGEGAWLIDAEGRRYLDGISSWWVNLFGHANPRIAAVLAEQARTLEHVIFAGFTHEPAIRLAEELVRVAPPGLERVFYADNGSSAIEVALKMSFHYWLNLGHGEKTRFIALSGSYHGETLGALSVSDVALY